MNLKLFSISLFFIFFFSSTNAQDFQWVRQFGDRGNDEAKSIDVDDDGNSYSLGIAQSYEYDLDPTPTGTQIINNLSNPFTPFTDIYLVKLNNNGDFVWGKTFGALKNDQDAYQIKIGADGNIYAFLQNTSFSNNRLESFITIIKISSDGDELSKIIIKNPDLFQIIKIDIDRQNNFLVSANFSRSKTVNFNNVDVNFEAQNGITSYLFKLDNSGNFIWKKKFDSPESSHIFFETKPDGNIIAVLNFTHQSYTSCSIFNIDTRNANIIWEKKLQRQNIDTFHLDRKGNIVMASSNDVYQGATDVDPSSNVVNTTSQKFLLWFDSNGTFLDLKEYFIPQYSTEFRMRKIESDIQNNIYLVGDFNGGIDADPSSNTFLFANPHGTIQYGSGYVIKFDSNRNFSKVYSLYSNYRSLVKDIKVKNRSIYLLGDFNGECDFDPGVGDQTLNSLHNGAVLTIDGFIVKLSPCDPSKPDGEENQFFCTSQNSSVADLIPNYHGIKWYDSPINGTLLSGTTNLENGKSYYATQSLSSCETERLAVNVTITSTPSAPTGNTDQAFCKKENATLNTIQLSGKNIKWYDTNFSTSTLPNTTLLENNRTYYASQTVGCESDRIAVLVHIHDPILPIANPLQTFCIYENATINNIEIVTGQNIKWYDALTTGTLLPNTTLLQEGTTYYASQTISGCESERTAVTVKIYDTPAPTGDTNQPFCTGQNPTLQDIVVTGESLKWHDALTNGNSLSNTATLQNGITYYVSQTLNSCESKRLAVTVSVQNTPGIPTGDLSPEFCKSENATLSDIVLNESNLKWYNTMISAAPLPNTTVLQNNTTYYVSQAIGCESDRIAVLVTIYDTALPTANTAQTFCIDDNATINDIAILTGQNLKWYDAETAGNVLTSTTTLENRTYYVSQTNTNCESQRLGIVIKIQDTQAPTAHANQTFCIQENATIGKIEINGQNIKWYNAITAGVTLSESTPLKNEVTYFASQTINDCESERTPITIKIDEATATPCTKYINELPYPKFFTPNNDTFHDTWTIDFDYLAPNTGIRIFDRYGKFIKELTVNTSWDGTYTGQDMPASDYWFSVTRLNGTTFTGHFTLKR